MKIQITDEHRACAKEFANKLGETGDGQRLYILRAVAVLGVEQARQVVEKSVELGESGKVMVKDGSRPRTKGGVFFALVKFLRQQKKITSKQYHFIQNARYVMEHKKAKAKEKGRLADAPENHLATPLQ